MMGDSDKLSFEKICLLEKVFDVNNEGTLKMAPSGVAWRSADKTQSVLINSSDLRSAVWRRSANGYEFGVSKADGNYIKWSGFEQGGLDVIRPYVDKHYGILVMSEEPAVKGFNWGEVEMTDNRLVYTIEGRTAFEVPLAEIQQTDKDARKTEVALMFPAPPGNPRHETLDSIRFFFQKDAAQDEVEEDVEGDDEEKPAVETRAERLYNQLSQITNKDANASLAIVTFPEIACRIPRGRYNLRLFEESITFHGPKFTYSIPYSQIQRLFLLEKADQSSVYFAIYVDPPIRQGQTSYPFFIMEINSEDEVEDLTLNIPDEDLKRYDGLDKEQTGPVFRVLSRILKKLAGASLSVADKDFTSARNTGAKCVTAALKNESGLLYPLKNALVYMFKPALYILYADIRKIEFDRQAGVTSKTFNMTLEMKRGASHTFSSIGAEEYDNLVNFMKEKNIKVEENEQADYSNVYQGRDGEKDHYLEQIKGGDSSESEDDDFNPDEDSDSDVADEYDSEASDSEEGSGSDEGSGSGGEGSPKKRKKAAKEKPAKKHKPEKKRKEKKARKKDANAPKKPLTSYMAFSNEMRPQVREENPDMSLAEIGKKLGEMWNKLGEDGQKAYKDAYERDMEQWRADFAEYKRNNPDASGEDDDDETPKKKAKAKSSSKPAAAKSTSSKPAKKQEFQSAEFIEDSDEEAS